MEDSVALTDPRLDWHLDNWAGWMRGTCVYLRYPSRSAGGFQAAHSDFDAMVDVADNRCARAVDAILDGLPVTQVCAVHHRLLGSVWRFPKANVDGLYETARLAIGRGLDARGIF